MDMATETKLWTLEELLRLPDDGNTYELVRGELFVTPPPTFDHGTIVARLTSILVPFVSSNGLGYVYHPQSVLRFEGSQVEPDLMVRQVGQRDTNWDNAPVPTLVVEVLSPSTRQRDQGPKRDLYMDAAVPEYWIVDPERREIRSIRRGHADVVATDTLAWTPPGAASSFVMDLAYVFGLKDRRFDSER